MTPKLAAVPTPADPEDVFVEALDTMPEEWLQCREMQHAWKTSTGFRVVDTDRESGREKIMGHAKFAERTLVCTRCSTTRADRFSMSSSHGHTVLRKIGVLYTPPEGYYVKGIGNARGLREFLYGVQFDRAIAQVKVGPGRPKKGAS